MTAPDSFAEMPKNALADHGRPWLPMVALLRAGTHGTSMVQPSIVALRHATGMDAAGITAGPVLSTDARQHSVQGID